MFSKIKKTLLCLLVVCMIFGCVSCNFLGKQEESDTNADSNTQGEAPAGTENNTGNDAGNDAGNNGGNNGGNDAGNNGGNNGGDNGGDTTPTEDRVDIKLGSVYANIIYSVDRDDILKEATKSFAEDYAKVVGVGTVTPTKAGAYDADKPEILIGNLNKYPECAEIYKTLTYDEVKVCVVGSKLVIAGYNTTLMAEVLDGLADQIEAKKDSDGNISLGNDFLIEESFAKPLSAVPVLEGAKPAFVDTGDNCYMVNFGETDKEVFTKYCADIVAKGFTVYAEKTMENNIYNTYVNDEYVVTAIYTGYNKYAKVLSEPLSATALPTKAEDNVYTPLSGCETTITQLGMYRADDYSETYNGMCYIVRLADGSFIVYDAGVDTTKEKYEDRIYETLKKQAPDPDNIVIAAWIISHAHDDHVDILGDFFKSYADKITVERFICNFPSDEQVVNIWEPEWNRSDWVRDWFDTYFPDVPVIKAHPGQEFHIRNAKITILYTWDILENKESMKDFNNTSVVFKLEAEGTKVLFLGDYDDKGATMKNLYSLRTLKSNVMQMAHHGLPENSSNAIASIVQPDYVFWPVAAQVIKNGTQDLFAQSANQWIVDNRRDKIYLAEDNVFVFNMKDRQCVKYETLADYLAGNGTAV